MDVKIHSIHFNADQKLLDFVNEKVGKLQQYYDNIIAIEVFLRLDKNESKENKIAEIKVLIPGKELFAKKQCASFEEATDLSTEALRRQIRKYKGKLRMAV